jgi:hypothetical protein
LLRLLKRESCRTGIKLDGNFPLSEISDDNYSDRATETLLEKQDREMAGGNSLFQVLTLVGTNPHFYPGFGGTRQR